MNFFLDLMKIDGGYSEAELATAENPTPDDYTHAHRELEQEQWKLKAMSRGFVSMLQDKQDTEDLHWMMYDYAGILYDQIAKIRHLHNFVQAIKEGLDERAGE